MAQQVKPIKRSKELVPLSKDHHDGLLLCWKIRQGLKNKVDTERIVAYVLCFYENDLATHFEQEEELVFSLLAADDPMKLEAIKQHRTLNGIYKSLKHQAGNTEEKLLLNQFEQELNGHIRFEERELFPYIEKMSDPDQFRIAGKQIADLHQGHECLVWKDEFWATKI
ncbi:hemerythrin domain-containing protein [Polluticoccus soli]|uniref:hemerythrin domain-containing protein n=1 Tax=Polluticoccus soli TaxID=3034150 RepID=UPI0023E2335E|nr:hemerythrin domain-containing protein [Flavipsychrobacter sp. JY13-12]